MAVEYAPTNPAIWLLEADRLEDLLAAVTVNGRQLIGPTVRDGAIVYDEIEGIADLPQGWTDRQSPGFYRLVARDDRAYFGFTVGQHSWKKMLLPPRLSLFRGTSRAPGQWTIENSAPDARRMAFIGVRSCELHAIAIQDRVLMGGSYVDPHYAARREQLFIVALQCGQAASTCFCVSMKSGPRAVSGFDLALTELIEPERHAFVVEAGSDAGARLMKDLKTSTADPRDRAMALDISRRTAAQMGRELDTDGIKELLYKNLEHPRWNDVAARCLSCGNCTMVCPTCFCTSVEDSTSLAPRPTSLPTPAGTIEEHGTLTAERERRWDSCFTMDHSYLHGGSVRPSTRGRYRQWLTHKLATWHDQFGTSGCVGCGRCLTWCPVGIDITEEVAAIRASVEAAIQGRHPS